MESAIRGFEKSEVLPWIPQVAKTGKLVPMSIYEKPDPLPEMDNGIFEPAKGDVPVEESVEPHASTSATMGSLSNPKQSGEIEIKKIGDEPL